VKKTVVGVGHAAKVQVDHMVKLQLPGVKIAGRMRRMRWRWRSAMRIMCSRRGGWRRR
jgi:hypothetical protein